MNVVKPKYDWYCLLPWMMMNCNKKINGVCHSLFLLEGFKDIYTLPLQQRGFKKRHIDKIFLFVSENPEILVRSNHGCTIFSFCDKGIKYDMLRRVWEIEYININSL